MAGSITGHVRAPYVIGAAQQEFLLKKDLRFSRWGWQRQQPVPTVSWWHSFQLSSFTGMVTSLLWRQSLAANDGVPTMTSSFVWLECEQRYFIVTAGSFFLLRAGTPFICNRWPFIWNHWQQVQSAMPLLLWQDETHNQMKRVHEFANL